MRTFFYLCIGLMWSFVTTAETISVAVAGGFKPAMQELQATFEKETGNTLLISYASVGMLYAQISQHAPFDVFISADIATPKKIEDSGFGVKGTRFTHSKSRLVLWSPKKGLIDSQGLILKSGQFSHLALPNPKVGVHGKTAVQTLKALGVYDAVKSKLVEGKNALQTLEFLDTGAADLGFVSYSLIYHPTGIKGSYWLVPADLYTPMVEQAILLNDGKDKPAASQLLAFIRSDEGKTIIKKHGYLL